MALPRWLDVANSFSVSLSRAGIGMLARENSRPAERPLVLYEFEACPYCRKVREALSELNLDVDIKPCPPQGTRFREELKTRTGKQQFPYLIDPNTGWEGFESGDINRYLFETYGDGRVPLWLGGNALATASSGVATALRPWGGRRARPSRAPEKPLELYGIEISPFCRIAREALCELELPYRLHNVARKSPSRKAFIERSGKMLVPYLIDPNTGREMFESQDIVNYLNQQYGA